MTDDEAYQYFTFMAAKHTNDWRGLFILPLGRQNRRIEIHKLFYMLETSGQPSVRRIRDHTILVNNGATATFRIAHPGFTDYLKGHTYQQIHGVKNIKTSENDEAFVRSLLRSRSSMAAAMDMVCE